MALFHPFRCLGTITDAVPFAVQRRGRTTFVTFAAGKYWQLYNCAKLTLIFVGGPVRAEERGLITCIVAQRAPAADGCSLPRCSAGGTQHHGTGLQTRLHICRVRSTRGSVPQVRSYGGVGGCALAPTSRARRLTLARARGWRRAHRIGTWRGTGDDVVSLLPLGDLVLSLSRDGQLTVRERASPLSPAHPALTLSRGAGVFDGRLRGARFSCCAAAFRLRANMHGAP